MPEIFDRLEAATSRLEDMAVPVDSSQSLSATPGSNDSSRGGLKSNEVGNRGNVISSTSPSLVSSSATTTGGARRGEGENAIDGGLSLPVVVSEFDKIISEEVTQFVEAGEKIGELVHQQVCSPSSCHAIVACCLSDERLR